MNETDGNFSYNGVFTYDQSNGLSFSDDMNLPEKFRNLKKHVKTHIKKSKAHISNLNSELGKQNAVEKKKLKAMRQV